MIMTIAIYLRYILLVYQSFSTVFPLQSYHIQLFADPIIGVEFYNNHQCLYGRFQNYIRLCHNFHFLD